MASGERILYDPWEALGLERTATAIEIKERYRELARRYHPNRHPGPDASKAALSEHFYFVHQAWLLLKTPHQRRRYAELLQLAEEQDALLARMADILNDVTQQKQAGDESHRQVAKVDASHSSDGEEDELPRVGKLQRRATLEQMVKGLQTTGDTSEAAVAPAAASRWSALQRRIRGGIERLELAPPSTNQSVNEDGDYFTQRRKKIERLKTRELSAFVHYRHAMVNKFEAEREAEKCKELYERARWRREYLERAPRETTHRFRSFQHFLGAVRAFEQFSGPRRRNRSTLSYGGQILSTEDAIDRRMSISIENLHSPSHSKLQHRRGWSSDISGDQESSDDNSGGPPTPRPGSPLPWYRRQSRYCSLETFANPIYNHSDPSTPSVLPGPEPFRLIVREPTGSAEAFAIDDLSPDSESATPRSSSPLHDVHSVTKFTLVPPSPFLDFLGMSSRPTGAPAAPSRAQVATNNVDNDLECSFQIKNVRRAMFENISMKNVHVLTPLEKRIHLGTAPDAEADPHQLLQRLAQLDEKIASNFMVKPDIMEEFAFRLIYGRPDTRPITGGTFIALSYRRRLHVEKKDGYFTLPLNKSMMQAFLDERQSEKEGMWIDQISIDQDNDYERTVSMSAMDMVYRSARLVVVVLDDIELSAHEGDVLEHHMDEFNRMAHVVHNKRFRRKQPPYLDTHDELYQVLGKLLRSSWFRRAWCRHEMRLARDHVFLVPCKRPGTWAGMSIVRFTGQCLTHLLALATEVPFEDFIEMVKPALYAFFRDRAKMQPRRKALYSHHGNFTTVVAEVFAMDTGGDPRIPSAQRQADARKDKVAIILNTLELGLSLTQKVRDPESMISTTDCYYMLSLLAIAARDPGALCSVGPPMRLTPSDAETPTASSTWLFEPTNVDAGLNNYRTLNRMPADACIITKTEHNEHYVELDLQFLGRGGIPHFPDDQRDTALAKRIMSFCERKKLGRNRKRYLLHDQSAKRHFGAMNEVYMQTLACIFECGPDWMDDICHRYGVARTKQGLQSAYELLVAFQNTAGRWPESAWSEQAAGFIMDFANFLIIRGMPQRMVLGYEEWRPIWVTTPNGGKVVTYKPPRQSRPAIPVALLDADYVHLARLWAVEPRDIAVDGQTSSDWTLLGKSVLFGDDLATQQINSDLGNRKEHQRVFGREDAEFQRLLRERSLHV